MTQQDKIFETKHTRGSDFEFNAQVAQVFDDMLGRSVPFYLEQQRLIQEIVAKFWRDQTVVYDLGCSTGTTLLNIARQIQAPIQLVGYDNSHPMLEKARRNADESGLGQRVQWKWADFNADLAAMPLTSAGAVTLCWTLQFVRPLQRDKLVRWIYDHLCDGGVLLVTEKILTQSSDMNRFFIDFYYDFKRRNGYSDTEIQRKRESLENVLVPYRHDENIELMRRSGFQIVETFFQWYNFSGLLCVKSGGS